MGGCFCERLFKAGPQFRSSCTANQPAYPRLVVPFIPIPSAQITVGADTKTVPADAESNCHQLQQIQALSEFSDVAAGRAPMSVCRQGGRRVFVCTRWQGRHPWLPARLDPASSRPRHEGRRSQALRNVLICASFSRHTRTRLNARQPVFVLTCTSKQTGTGLLRLHQQMAF